VFIIQWDDCRSGKLRSRQNDDDFFPFVSIGIIYKKAQQHRPSGLNKHLSRSYKILVIMSDIFSWLLLLRSDHGSVKANDNRKRETTAPSPPVKRRLQDVTTDDIKEQSKVVTPTKQPRTNQRKSPSCPSTCKRHSKIPKINKPTLASPQSSKSDSEEWLQNMQAWLLHAEDGPKLTRKLVRQTMDSVRALASGQGLPATVYSGGAIFLPYQSVDWESVNIETLKERARSFCRQENISNKRTGDVFVGPMEHVQLYRVYQSACL
jgi:hypothetical protein